jgi:hypothetical protein
MKWKVLGTLTILCSGYVAYLHYSSLKLEERIAGHVEKIRTQYVVIAETSLPALRAQLPELTPDQNAAFAAVDSQKVALLSPHSITEQLRGIARFQRSLHQLAMSVRENAATTDAFLSFTRSIGELAPIRDALLVFNTDARLWNNRLESFAGSLLSAMGYGGKLPYLQFDGSADAVQRVNLGR